MSNLPSLFRVEIFADDRGTLSFCNQVPFDKIKRFYQIDHDRPNVIRAFHGHFKEAKYLRIISGSCIVGIAPMVEKTILGGPGFESAKGTRYVLNSKKPQVLYIPAGYVNGFMNLSPAMTLLIYSTSSLEESKADDYRFSYDTWDIWNVQPR
jgi:dTDP-4-dehydrorhamnose 3,5-epimerase-like enzyme